MTYLSRYRKYWMMAAAAAGVVSMFTYGSAEELTSVQTVSAGKISDFAEFTSASAVSLAVSTSTDEIFTDRDLKQTADLSEAVTCTVSDGAAVSITEEGVYVISGSAENATITVDTDDNAKVQLVLDGVSIRNDDFPAIYVKSADKVFFAKKESREPSVVKQSILGFLTAPGLERAVIPIRCESFCIVAINH